MAGARINPNSGRKKVLPIVAGVTQYFNADGTFLGNRFNVFQIYNDCSAALYVGMDNNIGAAGENSLALVVPAGASSLAIVGGTDTLYMRSAANGSVRIFYFYEENLTSNQLYQTVGTVIINSGLATDTTLVAEIPAGTQQIGQVGLVAGTANIGDVDVLSLPTLPAGSNNIGDVDVLTLPALPAGTNNIGKVDINFPTATAVKLTLAAGVPQTVKASAGYVMAIMTVLTDLSVKDGATAVWQNSYSAAHPFYNTTDISVVSTLGGDVYVVYK